MPYNILLMDDDREFREEIKSYLNEYKIVEASNGKEALKLLKKPNVIDLAILDIVIPDMRGTEVLARMRKLAPNLGIIMLTGFSSKDAAISALKGHADDYIEKPVDIANIKESIEELLEKKGRKGPRDTGKPEDKIEKVKVFARRNWDKKLTLTDAAANVYLSPKYLSRIFKRETGLDFNDYKLMIKIDKARALLKTTGMTIEQISYKLGYLNAESFIRIFKKIEGTTPTGFRNAGKRKVKQKPCRKKRKKSK